MILCAFCYGLIGLASIESVSTVSWSELRLLGDCVMVGKTVQEAVLNSRVREKLSVVSCFTRCSPAELDAAAFRPDNLSASILTLSSLSVHGIPVTVY